MSDTSKHLLLNKDDSDAISGFYYDQQIQHPTMMMSLHANRKFDKIAWEKGDANNFWTDCGQSIIEETTWKNDKGVENGYDCVPIATAILNEDFQVGVANQFDDSSITDDLTQLFNQVKPLGVYGDFFLEKSSQMQKEEPQGKWSEGIQKALKVVSGGMRKVLPYLNRALVVQGSRFTTYNGSGVAFGNLNMKFTLFSDWTNEIKATNGGGDSNRYYTYGDDWKWVSCIDKVKNLIPYCIGRYTALGATAQTYVDKKTNEEKTWFSQEQADFYNKFLGWQIPPGGYKPDLKSLDNIQGGTLMVIFGGMYSIPNLIIQDAQFNFSKQRVKQPVSPYQKPYIDTCPMYCDVQLTLKPASKYSDISLEGAITGQYVSTIKTFVNNEYNDRLENLSKKVNEYFNKD